MKKVLLALSVLTLETNPLNFEVAAFPPVKAPDKDKLVPDATPKVGVLNVGLTIEGFVFKTTLPVPVAVVVPVPPHTTSKNDKPL